MTYVSRTCLAWRCAGCCFPFFLWQFADRVTPPAVSQGFKIIFHFTPNKFFTNSELVKTFYIPNMFSGSEPMLERVEG